jgi:SAM-dependent methyltransferase
MGRSRTRAQAKVFEGPPADRAIDTYQPLPSIWDGSDVVLLERLLEFYPRKSPKLILDATVNAGRFWAGSERTVIGLDINPGFRPDVTADNRRMPFENRSFDAVVYDPPHVPNQGRDKSKDFNSRFGLVLKSAAENGYSFAHLYPPFVREAFRVLRPEGVLFCKIADYVHNHRYQWAHVEFLQAAVDAGFCACDCIIKVRKGPIVDPRWKTAYHARRQHCYWLVFRKSSKCG